MTKDNKNLRPYQIELIKNARYILKSNKSLIIQGSTGMGKTVLASFMLKALAEQNKRGLFICHRRELIEQASKSFNDFNINHAIIGTGYKKDLENPIQICSALSLFNKLDLIKKPDFIIWDECHHIASSTWSKIFNYFPNAHHIGLTATPQRLDGKGLGKFFEKMVQAPPMRELINQGYLSDFDIYAPSKIDLEGVASKNGDYDQEQLNKVVNKSTITGCAIEHYKKICNNKKAIVFCVSINHSLEVVKKFNDAGIKAAHIDGQMTNKQRDELINKFQDGELKILSNVDIVGEGFDLPAIEAAILLRPTQSLTLYLQQVGRALRRSQGKDKAIILDHAGNVLKHKMPDFENIWDLNCSAVKKKDAVNPDNHKLCPECSLVVNRLQQECNCGHCFSLARKVEILEGTLSKIEKKQYRIKIQDFARYYNKGYTCEAISRILKMCSNDLGKLVKEKHPLLISRNEWKKVKFEKELKDKYTINPNTSCWEWKGAIRDGNPSLSIEGKQASAKKYFYSQMIEDLGYKRGWSFSNKCNNNLCVNPTHLIKISNAERTSLRNSKMDIKTKNSQHLKMRLGQNKEKSRKAVQISNRLKRKSYIIEEIATQKVVKYGSTLDAYNSLGISAVTFHKYRKSGKPYKGYLIKSYLPF